MFRKALALVFTVCALSAPTAVAAPATAPLPPKGFERTSTFAAKVWAPNETDQVTIYASKADIYGRLCVVRPNGRVVWATMENGSRDLPARVQGGARQTATQLVYPIEVPGARLLLVTCYMADAYVAVIFRPAGDQLREVFLASYQDGLKWDAARKRLSMRRYIEEGTQLVRRTYRWNGRTFVIDAPAKGKGAT